MRHYGLLANRSREAKLAVCRRLLLVVVVAAALVGAGGERAVPPRPCPACGGQSWQVVVRVPRPCVAEVSRLPLGLDSG